MASRNRSAAVAAAPAKAGHDDAAPVTETPQDNAPAVESKDESKSETVEASPLAFDDAPVPAVTATRAAAPNPFADVVKALADSRDDKGVSTSAKAVTVAKDSADKMVRLLQNAGKGVDATVRSTRADVDGDKVRITFWVVNKITRPRKDKETPAETAAAEGTAPESAPAAENGAETPSE